MRKSIWLGGAALVLACGGSAQAQSLRPDQAAFREIYREMVETNTTRSVGSCTELAEKVETRLLAAGLPRGDVRVVPSPVDPRWGSLTAVFRGSDARAKPILLLAHIDVVEANRADWERDPFTLVEENGVFYGRGSSDDKAQAAVWVDSFIRFRQAGFKPRRDIKMALTCGEETPETFNGVEWLLENARELVDAEFALNEGAGGLADAAGARIALNVQAGQKVYQDFRLELSGPGGHSSLPVADNVIYRLSAAALHVRDHGFKVELNDANRGYFTGMAPIVGGEAGAAMRAVVNDPGDAAAIATLARNPSWNSMLRTTCVATTVQGGHAPNALPQRAAVNVNCRMFPGRPVEEIRAELERVIADPGIKVSVVPPESPTPPAPRLTERIMGPVRQAAAKAWPGVPVIPVLSPGATDGRFLTAAGIPTYGVTGFFHSPGGPNAHGLNEHISVRSLMEGRDFLHDLVQIYALQK
ncbi:M20/M25/M40 family metallo-hydrolase [Phenylobacterium sp.]|uniref:M20/M25/M40 family metallo-hydrolase n=1 Tax=Phenylobacterium sp. TaxID=1871053 RepID=UPI00301C120E